MKIRSPMKTVYSLVLILTLTLTITLFSPNVAFAQSTDAIDLLKQGIEANDKGDIASAEFFYEGAINQVLNNQDVDVLITAKTLLADLLGDTDQAKLLREQAGAGEKLLGGKSQFGGTCGECNVGNNSPCMPGGQPLTGFNGNGECSGIPKQCRRCR